MEKKLNPRKKKKLTAGMVVRRTLLAILSVLVVLIVAVYSACYTVIHGPSPTIRNLLVLSAMQASATKWAPGLFLSQAEVDKIISDSKVVNIDEIDIDDYTSSSPEDTSGGEEPVDEWANAQDGMQFLTVNGSTFKGYLLIVKDPSRIYVATSSDYKSGKPGMRLFEGVQRENAVAAINGGEFSDIGGMGDGATPIGLTYSLGQAVWNDGASRTFIGFDKNNKLVVSESMTKAEADELGIRDAVSFQNGNVLIDQVDNSVRLHYNDGDNGTSQRTAIGQRADGAVLLLVTDGRSASSLGATHNDIIDVMVDYGAVTAGMLDGGSSSMMYYRDYMTKYNIDESTLDEYQKQGLVNKYKAFTQPRQIPTYFMVKEESAAD